MVAISVIIPTYNRAARLRACLDSLARQTQPASEFEVIVIVDGSTDETGETLSGLRTPYSLQVRWQSNAGQHVARNEGIEAAKGQYCLFLDDDVLADPALIAEHLHAQQRHGGVVAIGRIDLELPSTADGFVRAYGEGWRDHYTELGEAAQPPSWVDCYGGNLSVPRSALMAVGLFAADLPRCHDIELGYRLAQSKLPFVYLAEARGRQVEDKNTRALAAAFERSGAAWFALYTRHPGMLGPLLGEFNVARRREVLLRRLLLALDLPTTLLASVGRVLPGRNAATKWHFFLHRYSYWRGVRRSIRDRDTWRRLTSGTPILMYHAFAVDGEAPSRYVVSPRRFAAQLRWLRRLGFQPLTLEEYLAYRREDRLPPARAVVLTIDDGYRDACTVAAPILRQYGCSATIFLVTQAVGRTNDWSAREELAGRPLLSWSDIRAMQSATVQFGAHTRTHPLLPSIPPARARDEIVGSRLDLEREIGRAITTFAFPYGASDPTIEAVVRESGLLGACGAKAGLNHPATSPFRLRRVAVHGTDSLGRFLVKLWLGDVPNMRQRRKRSGVRNHH